MIFFLTYNEAPSGIFTSQVIDVVKFIKTTLGVQIRLVAFISIRNFFFNRSEIKKQLPQSIVLPMFPKMENWKKNSFLLNTLCFFYRPGKIISRSVMATKLSLGARDRNLCASVVYDGRGAIGAEWKEYGVVTNETLLQNIGAYEREVIQRSDFRIAVSQALVDFWKRDFAYSGNDYVIIPCTLNEAFATSRLSEKAVVAKRKELDLSENDTVFVYSGSVAGWQSFELMRLFLEPILKKKPSNKIVFFSPPNAGISDLLAMFPGQVLVKHLKVNEVQDYLIVGDYGLLIRENSVTNQVASPVKYAEYLCCGLKVLISENLGDYSSLTLEKNVGALFSGFNPDVAKPTLDEKMRISSWAIETFTKKNYISSYQQLLTSA